jgi:hypothetical protein
VCLAGFPIAVVFLQLIQPDDYTPVSHAMSELALGRAGLLMGLAFCGLGTGTILVAGVLGNTVERMRVRPILLLIAGVLDFVSAMFRINAPNAPLTTVSNVHEVAGALTFLLMTAAMFASYLPMRLIHAGRASRRGHSHGRSCRCRPSSSSPSLAMPDSGWLSGSSSGSSSPG